MGATYVGFVAAAAGEFVDDHPLPAACTFVGAGSIYFGGVVAVTSPVKEVLGGDIFHQLFVEVVLEDLAEVGESAVGH